MVLYPVGPKWNGFTRPPAIQGDVTPDSTGAQLTGLLFKGGKHNTPFTLLGCLCFQKLATFQDPSRRPGEHTKDSVGQLCRMSHHLMRAGSRGHLCHFSSNSCSALLQLSTCFQVNSQLTLTHQECTMETGLAGQPRPQFPALRKAMSCLCSMFISRHRQFIGNTIPAAE